MGAALTSYLKMGAGFGCAMGAAVIFAMKAAFSFAKEAD
jgi:hypothetical protein